MVHKWPTSRWGQCVYTACSSYVTSLIHNISAHLGKSLHVVRASDNHFSNKVCEWKPVAI